MLTECQSSFDNLPVCVRVCVCVCVCVLVEEVHNSTHMVCVPVVQGLMEEDSSNPPAALDGALVSKRVAAAASLEALPPPHRYPPDEDGHNALQIVNNDATQKNRSTIVEDAR